MPTKTQEQISYNMQQIKSTGSAIETALSHALWYRGLRFKKNAAEVFGKPDIVFKGNKIAVFCDSEFFHGYDWEIRKHEIKSNQDKWYRKIESNIRRDVTVNEKLAADGWTVLRFWGDEIKKNLTRCADIVEHTVKGFPNKPYRTVDLCAGIGGIRRGFERAGGFLNVLSAENDNYACRTYQHLYGDDPKHDITSDDFKKLIAYTSYDVLLAGFPCQTFSRVGLQEGFENKEKGKIFFHIADIIDKTRPLAFLLENVDHLTTIDSGRTLETILEKLVNELKYKVIGVSYSDNGDMQYDPKSFVRNSRAFGVPQNRPRTYIIGFDSRRFCAGKLSTLPSELPIERRVPLYKNLNDVLEHNVTPNYYMSSGYFETLVRHRERQERKGYGFGYRIINAEGNENPIANTLLATWGSGRERNLIYDPQEGIAGQQPVGKKTPLNDKGIRVMTPTEWGKLQGFVNYAFINDGGIDEFSFPDGMPDVQKYKQFGNSVTIPAIEEMARFMLGCLDILCGNE